MAGFYIKNIMKGETSRVNSVKEDSMAKEKEKRKQTSEIYITRENTDFFQTEDRELEKFCDLANQTIAIAYGYWGAVWRNHFQETNPVQLMIMQSEKRLYDRILDVDREAQNIYDKTLAELRVKMDDKAKIAEQAKAVVFSKIIENPKYTL